jgi:hypothetical protein
MDAAAPPMMARRVDASATAAAWGRPLGLSCRMKRAAIASPHIGGTTGRGSGGSPTIRNSAFECKAEQPAFRRSPPQTPPAAKFQHDLRTTSTAISWAKCGRFRSRALGTAKPGSTFESVPALVSPASPLTLQTARLIRASELPALSELDIAAPPPSSRCLRDAGRADQPVSSNASTAGLGERHRKDARVHRRSGRLRLPRDIPRVAQPSGYVVPQRRIGARYANLPGRFCVPSALEDPSESCVLDAECSRCMDYAHQLGRGMSPKSLSRLASNEIRREPACGPRPFGPERNELDRFTGSPCGRGASHARLPDSRSVRPDCRSCPALVPRVLLLPRLGQELRNEIEAADYKEVMSYCSTGTT